MIWFSKILISQLLGTKSWMTRNHPVKLSSLLTFQTRLNMSSINKPVVYITRNIPPEGMHLLQNEG